MRGSFLAFALLGALWAPLVPAQAQNPELTKLTGQVKTWVGKIRSNSRTDEKKPQNAATRANVMRLYVQTMRAIKLDKQTEQRLLPLASHLENLFLEFPNRSYSSQRPRSVGRALARQLERSAAQVADAAALPQQLINDLYLPGDDEFKKLTEPKIGDLPPTDMTLDEFKKLTALYIFFLKHRMDTPRQHNKNYIEMPSQDLAEGKTLVASAVMIRGEISDWAKAVDGDLVFNIGDVHCEITPTWRKKHPVADVQNGDLVEIYGWTYYDIFHDDEGVSERELTKNRKTVWEIHPVHKIQILKKAKRR